MIMGLIAGMTGFALGFLLARFIFEKAHNGHVQVTPAQEIPEEVKRQEEEEKNAFSTLLSYNIDMVYGGRGLAEEERE